MKKTALFFLIFTISNFSQEGWLQQNVTVTQNALNSIRFINDSTIFVVGNSGTIIKSTDFGMHWSNLEFNQSININEIFFINENFLSMESIGGEIPFYISSYNPSQEVSIFSEIERLKNRLKINRKVNK